MTDRRHVVVATGNAGKVTEIRHALDIPGWEFLTPEEAGCGTVVVDETGETFMDNALLKARAYRDVCGYPALADDSGLEVDALDGEPGVQSARYAGDGATDEENNALLLRELAGVPDSERTARFRCTIVLVDEDDQVSSAEGTCEGVIGHSPKGTGGFGYDPLFVPDEADGLTMAELPIERKNSISHRGRALARLRAVLES